MNVSIPGPCGALEGVLWSPPEGGSPRAVCAICHPHPEHGGTLDSSVVFRVARGLQAAGLAVLRFNFRGVGASAGDLPGDGEAEADLSAALDWLGERLPGMPLWAAGYSFGARTAGGLAVRESRIERVILVAGVREDRTGETAFDDTRHFGHLLTVLRDNHHGAVTERLGLQRLR